MKSEHYDVLELIPWRRRQVEADVDVVAMSVQTEPAADDWIALREKVAICTACSLHNSRTQTVFGVGRQDADLMIIGEAPGFYEDKQGEPFVGKAGQLLTAMLKAIDLEREQVFIANVLKCRPPENRDPLPAEVACCTPFLDRQIALVKPKLLLALGRVAAHYLLKTKSSMESMRNRLYQYGSDNTPLLVTYHPAYLLRNPADKRKSWEDLKYVRRLLAGELPV